MHPFSDVIWIFLIAALALYFIYCVVAAVLWIYIIRKKKTYIACRGEDILIVAPHQDDCVAIAGGYAIQTKAMGGRVKVLYVTDGNKDDKVTRKQEALDAWYVIGSDEKDIHFLKYHSLTSLTTREEIEQCTDEIADFILKNQPKTIFVSLYEGGNYQHDVVNYMVSEAVQKAGFMGTVYESPEYNFYLSFKTTPEKILSGFARFIPFFRYDYPPEPILEDEVLRLKMTPEQIRIKKDMLSKFKTQNPKQLIIRFGFEDRYQRLHNYDYSRPPFDYEKSVAKILNLLKALPIVGRMFSKMFKWTRTIHSSSDYNLTRIPMKSSLFDMKRGNNR
jgi:LmbE family N-acetylglucosaminyl deacetylase